MGTLDPESSFGGGIKKKFRVRVIFYLLEKNGIFLHNGEHNTSHKERNDNEEQVMGGKR